MSAAPRWRRAVVTGAARGLGAGFVDVLRAEGTAVLASDVRADSLDAFAAARAGGPPLFTRACDVRDPAAVEALAAAAHESLGGVDLWVNNAGIAAAGTVEETSTEVWARVLDVDLRGVVWGAREAVPLLRAAGGGAIVNVASAAALVNGPGMAAYNTAKSGVEGLSRSMAADLYGSGITVTVLCPTFFQTGLLEDAAGDAKALGLAAKLMARSPLSSEDVARRALDDAARGRLYSVPMADGRWAWRLRRWLPEASTGIIARTYRKIRSGRPR